MTTATHKPCWRGECRTACYYPETCAEADSAHTPDGGGLTEAERLRAAFKREHDHPPPAMNAAAQAGWQIAMARATELLADRATHADPRETAAAALDEAADALKQTWVKDGRHYGLPGCYSSGYERWLRARAADLRAGVREGRDT